MPSNSCRYFGILLALLVTTTFVLRAFYDQVTLDALIARLIHRIRAPQSSSLSFITDVSRHALDRRKANATFIFLCRNSELPGVMTSMEQMEDKFNKRFKYPWVFLNDEEFSDDFKESVAGLTDSPVHFGVIPHDQWAQPEWIDEQLATENREKMVAQNTAYGGSVSYRNMCRFNSGFFYRHEILNQFKYYWRVEPDVNYFCSIDYDPFLYMQDNNKVYGFTIAITELKQTVETLWDSVRDFIAQNPQDLASDNSIDFISDDGGLTYNLCHYWSNFEIGDMDFFRGDAYSRFFEHLEGAGGFYYERWGDAPVHSIGVSLLAPRDQVHFFQDIGYRHTTMQHCPRSDDWARGRCECSPNTNVDLTAKSCLPRYQAMFEPQDS